MYKAVLFDFDYTLGDSTNGIVMCTNYALENLGYEPKTPDEIRKTVGLSLKEMFAAFTGKQNGEDFVKLFRKRSEEVMTDNSVLYDGADEMLRELLQRGFKTGIVTTKFRCRIEEILRKYPQTEVTVIIGAEDVSREKPAPDGLLKAVDLLGLDKREVLYTGDSLVDALAANSAEVDFAGVKTGCCADFSQYNPVFVGNDVLQVFDFVTKE